MIFETLFIGLLGGVFASFLYTCGLRSLNGCSILERSHCPVCHRKIDWYGLIPVLGYLFVRGRCKSCHTLIPKIYLYSECLGVVSALYLTWLRDDVATAIIDVFMILTAFMIMKTDISQYKIPNPLLLCMLIAVSIELAITPDNIMNRFFGATVAMVILVIPNIIYWILTRRAGMGMGDIKYTFVLGLAVGGVGIFILLGLSLFLSVIIALTGVLLGFMHRRSNIPLGAVMSFIFIGLKIVSLPMVTMAKELI